MSFAAGDLGRRLRGFRMHDLSVEHEIGDHLRSLVMEDRRDVAVNAEGDGDRRVAKPFLHDPSTLTIGSFSLR